MMIPSSHHELTNQELNREFEFARKELSRQSFRAASTKRDSILGNKSSILGFEVPLWRNSHTGPDGLTSDHCDASDLKASERAGLKAMRHSNGRSVEKTLGLGDSLVCLGFDSGGNPNREREPTWKMLEHLLVIVFPLIIVAIVIPIVVYFIIPSWHPRFRAVAEPLPSINATYSSNTLVGNISSLNNSTTNIRQNSKTTQLQGYSVVLLNATNPKGDNTTINHRKPDATEYPAGFTDDKKTRWNELKTLVSQQGLSLSEDFTNPLSSAYRALTWIVAFDVTGEGGYKVSMEDSVTSKEDATEIHLIEKYALAAFFFATHPYIAALDEAVSNARTDNSIDWIHDVNENVCQWEGVQCGEFHRVGNLHLSQKGLSGTLPRELVGLCHLKNVDLSFNRIGGTLPPEWSQLTHLKHLFFASNKLEGTVPLSWASMNSHLVELDLSDNEDIAGSGLLP